MQRDFIKKRSQQWLFFLWINACDTIKMRAMKNAKKAINIMRRALNGLKPEEAVDKILDMFAKTKNNVEFVNIVKKTKFI